MKMKHSMMRTEMPEVCPSKAQCLLNMLYTCLLLGVIMLWQAPEVFAQGNQAPIASAAPISQTIASGTTANLSGTATDDGLPNNQLTYTWAKVSGPGTVTFSTPNALDTTATFNQVGTYVIGFTVSDSLLSDSQNVSVLVSTNEKPVVTASPAEQTIAITQPANLCGTATDDDLPIHQLTYAWAKVSGPGTVTFGTPNSLDTTAAFSQTGTYVVSFKANDSLRDSIPANATITVATNQTPSVTASPVSQTIELYQSVSLTGTATDDALPKDQPLAYTWSKVSGPGAVSFNTPNSQTTTATFSATGNYVIEFKADDSQLYGTQNVAVTVQASSNQAPTVSATPLQQLIIPSGSASLTGTASDDGLPGGQLNYTWSKESGPGTVTFGTPNSLNTTATFSANGSYVLKFEASDTALSACKNVNVIVGTNAAPSITVSPTTQTIDLSQTANITATVTDDGLPFGQVKNTWSKLTNYSSLGTVTFGDPSSPSTTVSFSEAGTYLLKLKADDSLLATARNVTVIVTSSNQAPTNVTASTTTPSINLSQSAVLNGTASDDGLPFGQLDIMWTKVSGPGHNSVTFEDVAALSTTAKFSLTGTYVLRLTVDDGEMYLSDDVTILVSDSGRIPIPQNRIEAEDYRTGGEGVGYHDTTSGNSYNKYRTDDVDIAGCTEGGYCISSIAAGEWLAYDVEVANSGFYGITARVATSYSLRKLRIMVDGADASEAITFNSTGGTDAWGDITTGVFMSAGNHVIKVCMDTDGFKLNYLDVEEQDFSKHIVSGGVANADIVISGTPPRTVTIAADELQSHIEQITGATLPIVNSPSGAEVHIYVGRSQYTDALGISNDGLDDDAFRIVSGGNWLVLLGKDDNFTPIEPYAHNSSSDQARALADWDLLTGKKWGLPFTSMYKSYDNGLNVWAEDGRGSLNAVYEFLRNLGVRWYFPGAIGQITPSMDDIGLPALNRTVLPDFAYRDICQYSNYFNQATEDEIKWQLRLGINKAIDKVGITRAHGILYLLQRNEVKAAHPEYYALYNGVRQTATPQACLSSQGLFEENVAFVRTLFDHYDEAMVSVMPPDGYAKICECPLCIGNDDPYYGWWDPRGEYYDGELSNHVWDYVNRIAAELYQTHPAKKIICCAYGKYRMPPTAIATMSPNLVVMIVQSRYLFEDIERNQYFQELTREWIDKLPSGQVLVFEHSLFADPNHIYHGIPVYYPELITGNLRFLKGKSGGEFIEVFRNPDESDWHSLASNHLNLYLTSRLYWGVEQDVNDILDEYYEKFYGPDAKDEMKAFLDYAEANWFYVLEDPGILSELVNLLSAAQTAAGSTGIYRERIDMLEDFMNQ